MFSFKNDLGIIPNEGTSYENNANLEQGQQFMEYSRVYSAAIKPHLYKLQLTSSPALQSITEALQGSDSTLSANSNIKSSVSKTEDEFNKTMSEYSQIYQELNKELLANNNSKKPIQKYLNNVITMDDKNFIYVNNYGYTHKYSNEAWSKNDKSCSSHPMKIGASELNLFNQLNGPDMGIGQACSIAGQNIQNSSTNQVAWVDAQGYKHIYPDTVWQKKSKSCGSDVKKIDAVSYDTIPVGSFMTETTPCNKLNVNPELLERLSKINDKLIHYAEKINNEMGNLSVKDDKIKNDISQQRSHVNNYINNLKKDKTNFNNYMNSDIYNSVNGQAQVSKLVLKSNYIHYIIWIFLLLTIFVISIHALTTESYGGISVIIGLAFIYIISRYFFNWM